MRLRLFRPATPYATDQTDTQWARVEPRSPPRHGDPKPAADQKNTTAAPSSTRSLDPIHNGIKWRALPADFPPWQTVYGYFARWSANLTTLALCDRLRAALRRTESRQATASAGSIDSQSVHRTAEATIPKNTSGFDSYKRVNGRKRHIAVDTLGLLLAVHVTPANTQDRDAAPPLLDEAALHGIRHIWADGGYRSDDLATWAPTPSTSPWKSCPAPKPKRQVSNPYPDAGSSNAPSPGSADDAAAPATTNASPTTTKPWSTGPPSST